MDEKVLDNKEFKKELSDKEFKGHTMKKGIIFDLDGTLWDSTKVLVKAWNIVLSEFPQTKVKVSLDNLKPLLGRTLEAIIEALVVDVSDEKLRIQIADTCTKVEHEVLSKEGGILYPMIEETLVLLSKKYKLYIVSNCQDGYIESFFAAHGLEKYFEDYECPGRSGLLKADNIRLIMERNNIDKAVYVGDTVMDYNAAKKAGIPFIHATYGFGQIEDKVEKIDNFSELSKLLFEDLLFI